ncbi:MAG TPA: tRNA uridine-5-carboxymethylaminomethyl(34) synthesis enzyme MnmG [Deltaproteobacteria bacterium]|nr:tRNA uridine-5-carboxymethylaminomethyl(34) synthesis enzyme MnmG [Deltaproteobacteria bacterium]
MQDFDIIIIGGGHAGAEAALAADKLGMNVALFTINLDTIGRMPCSPSVGGLAKSHLVKEIDALGGIMAEVADETSLGYRVLNTKKGPAVRATRTQNDRVLYEQTVKTRIENSGIHLRQARIDSIDVKDSHVIGVRDRTGCFYSAPAIIITAGTFLSGLIHIGEDHIPAGRAGEEGSYELADCLKELGFSLGRLKTGTPPRLHMDTIDTAALDRQDPEEGVMPLGLSSKKSGLPQLPCYMSKTTPCTHEIIRRNIELSPLYSGAITGTPARYCPSLEDKVMRFGDRQGHQIIIEPEGASTREVYASGLGNSLPLEIQWEIVHSVPGLEKAEILRPAYAIEYVFIHPTQLLRTLETKRIKGLYLAGQVNGTSGYEEAASQGLMAGINAAIKLKGESPFILDRSQAYTGVMIDDLVTRGTREPYRMFTSRSEYRLMLRETNALLRLSRSASSLGLISQQRFEHVQELLGEIEAMRSYLSRTMVVIPRDLPALAPSRNAPSERISLEQLLKRPEVSLDTLKDHGLFPGGSRLAQVEAEVQIKYEGYITRQLKDIEKIKEMEQVRIPHGFDYQSVSGLSNELRKKLDEIRPETLGQAALLEGMTPAGLQALHMGIRVKRS